MEDYTGMTRNELDEILKAHKKWVKNEKGGRHADFRGADIGGTTDLLVENQSMRNAADVSPVRHGRWVCVDTDNEQFFICNRCKRREYWESNYCPNCGAKMDAEG